MCVRHVFGLVVCAFLVVTALASDSSAQPAAPAAKTVRGTLVAKTNTTFDIQAEGEKEARRYVFVPAGFKPDTKTAAFIQSLAVGSEVQVDWMLAGDGLHIKNIAVLAPPGRSGLLVGTVTDKSPDLLKPKTPGMKWIEVKDEQGKAERYSPHWRIEGYAPPGGFDKDMLEAMAQRNVGDRVEIRWIKDDHVRVSTMRVLELAADPPEGAGGSVVGKVVAKDKDSVTLQAEGQEKQRYLPQRVIGTKDELDPDVLKAIAAAKVGDKLEARWLGEGERRLYFLKPAGKAISVPTSTPASRPAMPKTP